MREIEAKKITNTVKDLCIEASVLLSGNVLEALNEALKKEESPEGREIIRELIQNAEVAKRENLPIQRNFSTLQSSS